MRRGAPHPPAPKPYRTSWLLRDELERARFEEMHARLIPKNTRIFVVLLVLMAVLAPLSKAPSPAVGIAVIAVVLFSILQRVATRLPRPEVWVLVGLLGLVAAIPIGITMYESATNPAIMLVAWPLAGIIGRYNSRVTTVATAYTAGAVAAAMVSTAWPEIVASPFTLVVPVLTLVAVSMSSSMLRDGDLASRGAAIVDPLTGLLNRQALERQVPELEHQSETTGSPIAAVVLDLDHFKRINDEHGHAIGDQVLREVAAVLQHELRAYDRAYRLGGEEFVLLLPGFDTDAAAAVAERVRAAVARHPIAGLPIRLSAGVASSGEGGSFAWEDVFARADAALYCAKRGGRDRVATDPPRQHVAPVRACA